MHAASVTDACNFFLVQMNFAPTDLVHDMPLRSHSNLIMLCLAPRETKNFKAKKYDPAVVAWSVECLLLKKCHLLAVDRILLGTYAWFIIKPLI